jgi:hypothetical protein
MNAINDLAARLTALLPGLRNEFADWTIHRTESGRWLAIRGNVCIRAHTTPELRKRIHRHLAQMAQDLRGDQA